MRAAAAFSLIVLSAVPASAQTAPDGRFLPFANAPAAGQPLRDPPRLAISFGGERREAVVDTGSTGVVVSATLIPDLDRRPTLGPGRITYSSSGRVMEGRWVIVPIRIGDGQAAVETDPMPVLAVEAIRCTATARRCTPRDRPAGVAMLGIGFGREHDAQAEGTPDRNPMLRLRGWRGTLARGYVLSRSGIRLGAPRDAAGFAVQRLTPDPAHGDWHAPAACITVGAAAPACGTLLVDTGVAGMFLTVPTDRLAGVRDRADPTRLVGGTPIAVDLLPTTAAMRVGYRFVVGDESDPAAPETVVLAGIGARAPFVNTGVHLLNRFDMLFDAEAGRVGFRTLP